ncbi:MAG: DUF86 domain-containing protein [Acidobacteria bacterium]|nr:DUF86 domain-containing protein [Acidobacteriota bacterium]MCI0622430.1 DUF86 domain-containing protein [Acidobacteriota bacterium]
MIHAQKVHGILRSLDTYAGHLRSLAVVDKAALLADFTKTGSLRYYLQVSIECCLDLANHLIAAQALRPPKDYADAFAVLGEAGLVPQHFVPTLQKMARLRKRLVHVYWEVDDETLHGFVTTQLADLDRFKACVIKLLPKGDPGS